MKRRVKLDMDAMDRVYVFGRRPELTLPLKAMALLATVGTNLTALRDWGVGQISGAQDYHDGVSNRQFLAKKIRSTLNDMAALAQSMEEEGEIGMSDLFPYPKYLGYEPLLFSAESFADRAASITVQFSERGMPATFLDDLRAHISAFRAATDNKHHGKASRAAGTVGMQAASKAGMKAVRALRPIMRLLLKDEAALLTAWDAAARVERASRRSHEATPSEPIGSASAPGKPSESNIGEIQEPKASATSDECVDAKVGTASPSISKEMGKACSVSSRAAGERREEVWAT